MPMITLQAAPHPHPAGTDLLCSINCSEKQVENLCIMAIKCTSRMFALYNWSLVAGTLMTVMMMENF